MECAICQDELSQYVAKPSGCTHYFHEYCLSKWKFKTCPSCRSSYDVFEVLDLDKNMVLTRITAMSPNRQDLEAIQEDFPVGIPDPFIDLVCDVCNSGHDDHTLLICDGCSKGFHLNCVNLSRVPRTRSWYCTGCEPILRRPPPQERPRNRRVMRTFIYDGHDSANEEEDEASELEDEFDEEDSDRSQASLESFIDDRYASHDDEESFLASHVIDMILPTVGRRARGSRRASTSGRGTRRGGARTTATRRTRRTRTSTVRGGRRKRRRATRGRTRSNGQTTMEEYFRPQNNGSEDNIDLLDVLPTIREEVEAKYEDKKEIIDSYDLLGEILPQQEMALTPGHLLKIEGDKFVPRPEWNNYIEKKRNKHEKSVTESLRKLPPPPANIFTITLVSNGSSGQNINPNGSGPSQTYSSSTNSSRPKTEEKRRHRDESNAAQPSESARTSSPPRKQPKRETHSPSNVKNEPCEAEDNRPSTSRTNTDRDRKTQRELETKSGHQKSRHSDRRHEVKAHSSRETFNHDVSGSITEKRPSRENTSTKEDKPRSSRSDRVADGGIEEKNRREEKKTRRNESSRDTSKPKDRREEERHTSYRNKAENQEHTGSANRTRNENRSSLKSDEQQLHEMALIQMELTKKIEAEQHLMAMNQLAMQVSIEKAKTSCSSRLDSQMVRKEKQDLINFYDSIGKPEMKKLFQAKRITGDQYKNAMRLIVEKCRAKSVALNDSEQVRIIVRKVREKILRPAKSPS